MKKTLKLMITIIMVLGITLLALNFISDDNNADGGGFPGSNSNSTGTWDPVDRTCTGAPLNC